MCYSIHELNITFSWISRRKRCISPDWRRKWDTADSTRWEAVSLRLITRLQPGTWHSTAFSGQSCKCRLIWLLKKKMFNFKFAPRFLNRMSMGSCHLMIDTKSTVVKNQTCIRTSHLPQFFCPVNFFFIITPVFRQEKVVKHPTTHYLT